MGRHLFVVAACLAGVGAGAAQAAASYPRAEVSGVADKALKAMIQQAVGMAPTRPDSRLEARRRAREAADRAIIVLRSQGYYDYDVRPDVGEGDSPDALVTIDPGPVSTIAAPDIEWIGLAPDSWTTSAVEAAMALKAGAPGRADSVIAAEGRIVAAAQQRGYADAAAEPRKVVVDHADHTVRPTFRVQAGPLVHMGGVVVAKAGRTHPLWVARLAPWKAGQPYKPADVAELERRLVETGVFQTASVVLAPASQTVNGLRPVIVTLTDRPKGSIELGASYSTTEGVGVDSSWILYNRLGLGDTLTNSVLVANIDSRIQSELALPHFGMPDQTLKLTAALYRDNPPAYSDSGGGISADLTRRFKASGSFLTFGGSIDDTLITEKETINYVGDSRVRRLVIFGLLGAFSLDRSNDPLDPVRGWKLDVRTEPTYALGDGSIAFLKSTAQAAAYLPLDANADTVLAGRFKVGVITGGNIPGVPAQDRFYAGGGGSVRGYGYQLVGPRYPDNNPEGGLSLVEGSLELRRKLFGAWSVAAFTDAGTVGLHTYPDFREPSVGVGVGVRYNLGFAPVRIDIATPVNPRRGDGRVQLYLSIGQSF